MPQRALPERFTGDRALATAIYFLLPGGEVSRLHRIRQDELWHHYEGAPLTLHVIDEAGGYTTRRLGLDRSAGASPLVVVEAGCLFGATVDHDDAYTLAGCTVAPGFDFDDLVMPTRQALLARYPRHAAIIERSHPPYRVPDHPANGFSSALGP